MPYAFSSARGKKGNGFGMQEDFEITCPYCGEEVDLFIESDVSGTLVQDCEVCCNPWLLRVTLDEGERQVTVARADGSE